MKPQLNVPERFRMLFGEGLRSVRVTMGWTQAKLATEAGIQANLVSMLETGKRIPSTSNIRCLCIALPRPAGAVLAVQYARFIACWTLLDYIEFIPLETPPSNLNRFAPSAE